LEDLGSGRRVAAGNPGHNSRLDPCGCGLETAVAVGGDKEPGCRQPRRRLVHNGVNPAAVIVAEELNNPNRRGPAAGRCRVGTEPDDNRLARAAERGNHQPASCALEEVNLAGKRDGRNLGDAPVRAGHKVEHRRSCHRHGIAAGAVAACHCHDHHGGPAVLL
jgi:hypothetical protein